MNLLCTNKTDKIKFDTLKREVAVGIDDLDHGRFQAYTPANIIRLADEAGRAGRIRLKMARRKDAAALPKLK